MLVEQSTFSRIADVSKDPIYRQYVAKTVASTFSDSENNYFATGFLKSILGSNP